MRTTFINTLTEEAKSNDRIFIITPDLGFSVLERFRDLFPNRFLNVGIAEQNAVGVAAGLALSGKIVYVYSIVPFVTMRCFEQVRVDVAYMNTNVRLIGVGAGLSYGPAGATHHSIEDIAVMRNLPNMTVCCPGDPLEVREIVKQSVDYQGPMYIRLGKNGEPTIHKETQQLTIGKAIQVSEGKDLIIITTSNMLEEGNQIADSLKEQGKTVTLVSMHTIKPFDSETVLRLINKGIPMVTLEEHNIIGGLGSAVAEVIAESGQAVRFKRIGIKDVFCHDVGSQQYLRGKLINAYQEITDFMV
ncbi:1-deoxy-D-xylulose-5-phosphate synthase [Paenibacillus psychroresistens]|uniref:1-deoxy-D-xylulose-5-phosphate synthase n=1 Tax=Paenibacillus psychroresistens TaxID=1778678 RepID=A0A6B8RQ16_9BACL|nr:transketolase C-terminal domain-containing protein [Paenibacillus psychroresistens]QGQ98460.1 1-deoxy-D-xylulose-5-phosphate synthase [Paenibacillus psychroresistens]